MFIQHALKDETINIFSGGNELRSFLNIDDCANVILQSAFGKMQGLYNVVSSHAVSVRDIAQTIKSIAESNSEIVIQNRPIETRDMVFDNTHLKETFSFEEKPLELGLKEEIDYFKQLIA
jgi:nucleoside-diphosphate-sugar epimerase